MEQDNQPTSVPEEPQRKANAPIFNFPTLITFSIGLLVLIYVVQSLLLPPDWADWFVVTLAFIPARYVHAFAEQDMGWLWTPVSYSLLHGSWQHLVFNVLWMAIFGTPVVRRIGTVRYFLFWIGSSAFAAAFFALLHWGQAVLLIGASGAISALMGAACRFAFPANGRPYDPQKGYLYPLQSFGAVFTNRSVVAYIAAWLFGNVVVGLGLPIFGDLGGSVAWEAHLGGFLFGFALFGLFDPQRRQRGMSS